MQLTILALPLALALSAVANPLSPRQSARIEATFYKDTGCQIPTTAPSQYFDQINPGVCQNATIPVTYGSVFFQDNSIRRSSK
jgi:hypothetical protein